MPPIKNAYVRYRAIDKRLRRTSLPYPTIEQLRQAVEEVIEDTISISMIRKDIEAMQIDPDLKYHAPIEYCHIHKGWHYTDPNYSIEGIPLTEEELSSIEFAVGLLEQFSGNEFMADFESAITKIRTKVNISKNPEIDFIQVETPVYYGGGEYIDKFIEHIRNKEAVQINYKKFGSAKESIYTYHPYLLKEYHNRWYVIGYDHLEKQIKTFGLDRIRSLNVAPGIKYYRHPDFDPDRYFKFGLGITVINESTPDDIHLSFHPAVAQYIKTQPWHHTQTELVDNTEEFRIQLKLLPSMELVRQILSYGKEVKVLSPDWLREKVEGMK